MHTTSADKLKKHSSCAKVDLEMDKYRDVVLFPEKLARANEVIGNKEIPEPMRPKATAKK